MTLIGFDEGPAIAPLNLVGDQLGLTDGGGFWDVIGTLNDNFGVLGYVIVGLFVVAWLVSFVVYRLERYDEIEAIRALRAEAACASSKAARSIISSPTSSAASRSAGASRQGVANHETRHGSKVNGDFGLTRRCDSLGAPNHLWDATWPRQPASLRAQPPARQQAKGSIKTRRKAASRNNRFLLEILQTK
jgi:hypothetical protein